MLSLLLVVVGHILGIVGLQGTVSECVMNGIRKDCKCG